jgi:hypothetical protein
MMNDLQSKRSVQLAFTRSTTLQLPNGWQCGAIAVKLMGSVVFVDAKR